jgi:hypothetical protein
VVRRFEEEEEEEEGVVFTSQRIKNTRNLKARTS